MNIEDTPIEKLDKLYQKYFSIGYFNTNISTKFALISLICYLTFKLREKGKKITCYELITKLYPCDDKYQRSVHKSLACICEDLMYGCKEFPTFGINVKDMPNEIKNILNTFVPF